MDILEFIYWYFYGLENVNIIKPVQNDYTVVISSNNSIISVYLLLSGQICTDVQVGVDSYSFYFSGKDKNGITEFIENVLNL